MNLKGVFLVLVVLLLQGCQDNEIIELKTDLQGLETRLTDANKKIEALESQNNSFRQKLEEAYFKYENLQIQKTEMDEWTGYIIKGFGPCIWAGGQFERPIPLEPVGNGTPDNLLAKLNAVFKRTDSPVATLSKIENGTAFIKIADDEKLTQGMGTSGAANYINSIAYTLLSVKSIQCVDFDFEEGDHAFPGRECIKLNP